MTGKNKTARKMQASAIFKKINKEVGLLML